MVVKEPSLNQPACYQFLVEISHPLKVCELGGVKAPGVKPELKSCECSSPRAKSASVGWLTKEGLVDVLCPEGLMRYGDRMWESESGGLETSGQQDWWGQVESEKGKERDHWAWKAGRREGRALPKAAQHMKLQGEEQTILQHPSVSVQSAPHPLPGFLSAPSSKAAVLFSLWGK